MTESLVRPDTLGDELLMYWAVEHAKRYRQSQRHLELAQDIHESFLAEIMRRGFLDKFMERVRNG